MNNASRIALQEPYQPRPIRFLGLWQEAAWRIKVYGIAYLRLLPRPELLTAAKQIALLQLASVQSQSHYGVGFVGVHDGRGANFVFVDYWADENELHHHVYVSPSDQPEALEYVTPYHAGYFAAFLKDPEGNCVEVVCHQGDVVF